MDICVIGLGYIGLPTSVLFANAGFRVHGMDVNASVVKEVGAGRAHIVEPGLDADLARAVESGKLTASCEPVRARTFILAVPTPFKGDHEPDLSSVEAATRAVAPYLQPDDLVILESTSPVGTTEAVAASIAGARPDLAVSGWSPADQRGARVFVAHCPERVLPGQIMRELVENDRIIGGIDAVAGERAKGVYEKVVKGNIYTTSARLAEMSKLTENAFRDVNIAFANELSLICEKLEIDVWELISLANRHPRVNILNPGPGVGGHCIAVDPWFIVHADRDRAQLIRQAREINDGKSDWVVEKIHEMLRERPKAVVACLGLAYKPDIDDLRESPSIKVVKKLAREWKGELLVVEPHIDAVPKAIDGMAKLTDLGTALRSADIIVGLVSHTQFQRIDRSALAGKLVLDSCGLWRD